MYVMHYSYPFEQEELNSLRVGTYTGTGGSQLASDRRIAHFGGEGVSVNRMGI